MSLPTLLRRRGLEFSFPLLALLGCAMDPPNQDPTTVELSGAEGDLGAIQRTLALGMSGEDVANLHARLASYGYFPNEKLEHEFPTWQPIVDAAPSDRRVFDETTLRAVEMYQRNSGLEVTGEVDDATLAHMRGRFCGQPDGLDSEPLVDKFAEFIPGLTWPQRNFRWFLWNHDSVDLTRDQTRSALNAAFAQWSAYTNVTFTEVGETDEKDFTLFFASFGPGDGFNNGFKAQAVMDGVPIEFVKFDIDELWVTTWPPTGGASNLLQVATHEIGHLLNLGHSSVGASIMNNAFAGQLSPQPDDRVSVSVKYDTFGTRSGGSDSVADVSVSPSGITSWITQSNGRVRSNSFGSGGWTLASALPNNHFATRVATTPGGEPWVTSSVGGLFCRSFGTWRPQPGCLSDISVNPNNDIWAVTCDGRVAHWSVTRRCDNANGTPWQTTNALPPGETAVNIAVSNSTVYVTTNLNRILRRRSLNHNDGIPWEELPGGGRAFDVAVDPSGYVWVIGLDNGIWVHNEQRCQFANQNPCPPGQVDPGDNGASARAGYARMTEGLGHRIAASSIGPMVVGTDARAWQVTR